MKELIKQKTLNIKNGILISNTLVPFSSLFQADPLPAAVVELVKGGSVSSIQDLQFLLFSESIGKSSLFKLVSQSHVLEISCMTHELFFFGTQTDI